MKATFLYEKGDKKQSLDLFNKIAIYNESLSWYNLGVVRLTKKDYEGATKAFAKALNSNEHRCESALNAAVCSLILNKKRDFNYYIK
jgi:Tfp pilus assembly protein PilF